MNIRRFRILRARGATYAEIGRECGVDWRTVRKDLAQDAPSVPPSAPSRAGTQPRVIAPFAGVVEARPRVAAELVVEPSLLVRRSAANPVLGACPVTFVLVRGLWGGLRAEIA